MQFNKFINTAPDKNVKDAEYKRLLGYPPDHKLEGRALELAEWARQWYTDNGKPWIYINWSNAIDLTGTSLKINGISFSSENLCKQFSEANISNVMMAAVSAGKECEETARQLWEEGKPDEYFFLEVFGSAVVEHLITSTGWIICDWAEKNNSVVLPHYSPGYPGWNARDQKQLWELIQKNGSNHLPGELNVFDTGMLNPKKSLLAIFGITNNTEKVRNIRNMVPCEACSLQSCNYRRIPYKHYRPQIEDVSRLQMINSDAKAESVLLTNAKYSVSSKALEKWSKERLEMKILDDSSVEAKFKYEGTTCTNLGRRLEFHHHIKLSSSKDNYRIRELSCSPAPGDSGHNSMCEYIKDPETLMNTIGQEKPLLGKPLNDAISWERQFSPEGCYCNETSRDHKWGLAFEVLHYALSKYELNNFREKNFD